MDVGTGAVRGTGEIRSVVDLDYVECRHSARYRSDASTRHLREFYRRQL